MPQKDGSNCVSGMTDAHNIHNFFILQEMFVLGAVSIIRRMIMYGSLFCAQNCGNKMTWISKSSYYINLVESGSASLVSLFSVFDAKKAVL